MALLPHAEFLSTLPRKRVVTSAIISDSVGRVLCVDPVYKRTWHLPGGTVEAGESPSASCARECLEELGVSVELGRLLAVGHVAPEEGDPHGALAFVYEASIKGGTLAKLCLPPDEIRAVGWLGNVQRLKFLSPLALRLSDAGL